MALPILTLTDPQNVDADMSLPMSPTIKSPDTFTSFEFERSSGRPGTASSVGDGAGKYVIIRRLSILRVVAEKKIEVLSFQSCPVSQACFSWLVHVGKQSKLATSFQASDARVGAYACARIELS